MAIEIKRDGFGVVEDNHLSAKRAGHVWGQLPAAEGIEILENGMFVHYDYAAGEVNFDGNGPFYMVYNEEKLYDERKQMHKDYAMQLADFYDGKMYPRVIAIEPGDLWTTNTVADGEYELGDFLAVGEDGLLAKADEGFVQVVKLYTMPDGQPGLKLQCVAHQ